MNAIARLPLILTARVFERRPRIRFAKLKTIDLGHIGLGDTVMAWVGLHALLREGFQPMVNGCVMYVPNVLARLGQAIFSRHGIHVEGIGPYSMKRLISPVLSTSPPQSYGEWYRTFIGTDWMMNCFEALDNQKKVGREHIDPSARSRVRLGLSERILYRRCGWQAAVPDYVGYRLWQPIARKLGIMPLPFLTFIKAALPALRAEIAEYIDQQFVGRAPAPKFVLFPVGKSYQAFPAAACKTIVDLLGAVDRAVYVQADDPWIDKYREMGLAPQNVASVEELFWIVRSAGHILTTDSFSSHVGQLLRDDFVLALTRDFKEHVVHPGAHPMIVANHPSCAPCNYVPRSDRLECPAKYSNCIAFENKEFLKKLGTALVLIGSS